MCGLASRWVISRSVKNACMIGASAVMAGPRTGGRASRSAASASSSGVAGQVPVRRLRAAMCPSRPTGPAAVPARRRRRGTSPGQGRYGEGVPEVVDPGPAAGPRRRGDAGRTSSRANGLAATPRCRARCPGAGDEERRSRSRVPGRAGPGARRSAASMRAVVGCSGTGASASCLPVTTVIIPTSRSASRAGQRERLADPQPGGGEQADHRLAGRGGQRRAQRAGGVDQRVDLAAGSRCKGRRGEYRRWQQLTRAGPGRTGRSR